MKGIVFNLLEQAVVEEHGEDTWDALLEAAGVDGAYTSLGNYPDEELGRLVSAASAALETPPEDVVRWFGRTALPLLAQQYPQFFDPHTSSRSFMLTLNDIIHPEVRKLYSGAEVPVFTYYPAPDDALLMGYKSTRKLCHFGEGLIEGAAAHYNEDVLVEQPKCVLRGDDQCLYWVSFPNRAQSRSSGGAAA
jgi:hypothetical protein